MLSSEYIMELKHSGSKEHINVSKNTRQITKYLEGSPQFFQMTYASKQTFKNVDEVVEDTN